VYFSAQFGFVSTLAKWLAGKTILSWYYSRWRVSLTETRLKVIYCNDLLYVFSTGNIFNVLINFTFSTATYF